MLASENTEHFYLVKLRINTKGFQFVSLQPLPSSFGIKKQYKIVRSGMCIGHVQHLLWRNRNRNSYKTATGKITGVSSYNDKNDKKAEQDFVELQLKNATPTIVKVSGSWHFPVDNQRRIPWITPTFRPYQIKGL